MIRFGWPHILRFGWPIDLRRRQLTNIFGNMIKFPVVKAGMSNANFLIYRDRPYACYNKIQVHDNGRKLGFLTENTIFFVIQGAKIFYFNDHEIIVNSRQCVLLKRGIYSMSEFVAENQTFEALMIFVPDSFLMRFKKINNKHNPMIKHSRPYATIQSTDLLESFRIQYLSYFGKNIDNLQEILQLKLSELFLILFSSVNKSAIQTFINNLIASDAMDLDYIMKKHLLQPLKLSEIASLSNRSLAAFKRDFQELYHVPPKQWMNHRRLEHSYRELLKTDKQIAQISFECGYESTSHFIKIFKKQFGITPNMLRSKPAIPID